MDSDSARGLERLANVFSSQVLAKLQEGKVYRILVSLKYEVDGIVKGSSPMKSILITRNISSSLIIERIKTELIKFEEEYKIELYNGECFVGWKEWLSTEEFAQGVTNKKVDEILTDVLQTEIKSKNKYTKISQKMLDGAAFADINKMVPLFDSVVKGKIYKNLSEILGKGKGKGRGKGAGPLGATLVDSPNLNFDWEGILQYILEFNTENKYNQMYKDMKFNIKNVYLVPYKNMDTLLFVYEFKDSDKIVRYNCLTDYNSWFIVKDA
jgi:hypothetical protein